MIPIKIQCACGQRYAFEVEPVGGQVPAAVTCPACGADGTAAANAAIAQSMATQPPAPAAGGLRLRVAAPASSERPAALPGSARPAAGRGAVLVPGQIDRTQAKFEAKAKISWGDPPRAVLGYLLSQGFSREEASDLVDELFEERAATIRGNGVINIVVGIFLICVPIAALFLFMSWGYILVKTFAVTIIGGFVGVWRVIKGVGMLLAAKSQRGDIADQ